MASSTTAASPIVQLHNHSEYSLTDGAIRIKELVVKAKDYGHSAVALTDHGNMFGAIEFFQAAKSADIKPILGCDLFVSGGEETMAYVVAANSSGGGSKTPVSAEAGQLGEPAAFHLPVLAKSFDGYKSLIKIVSYGYRDWQTPVPIVSTQDFDSHAAELIVLSGGTKGEFAFLVSQLVKISPDPIGELVSPRSDQAAQLASALKAHVQRMVAVLGKGNYYIELVDNRLANQKMLLPYLVEFAKFFHLPLVATSDSHYLSDDDVEAHSVLTAIKNDLKMTDIRARLSDAAFHFLSDDEMQERFGAWPEALANTKLIADQVDIDIPFGKFYLPNFTLPDNQSPEEGLRHLSQLGLEDRLKQLGIKDAEPYNKRLKYELDVIISMGFPGYFLIVQDFINWAKAQGIPVGPGRGSGAGSLVAYALKITDLDPLPLNLIFERFLNPDRISMPDFDVDFCQSRRDEVIRYVTEKYGTNDVAQITTFGKMKAKAAVRDVGRVLELSYSKVDKIAKLIPNEPLDITLTQALEAEPRLKEEMAKDEVIADLMNLALKLEGISRHTSVHAAGVVISEGGMENFVPVHRTDDGNLVTQYEMKNAEKVGLVKFDFLGLKTLTVVEKAVQLVNSRRKMQLDIATIEIEDKKVYDQVSTGHTTALFQLESTGMQRIVTQLRPSRFEDIIAIVALFRPGPLGSGMVEDFIERKHGRQEITYPLPQLEPILSDTYGIILYQEQVQKIAATLANYSLGEADILRRAMGKKKPEEMAKQKTRFLSGCAENEIDAQIADDIFELMAKFAAYGFNKSHSAAYGLVSYQTAYMKTYYPEEFMAAIMTCDMDNTDKIVRYVEDCKRMNFTILAPDINRSALDFDVPKDRTVGFALRAIKGIGENPLALIVNEREQNGRFIHLTDFAQRVPLHKVGKKTLELLVQCGALSSFHPCRSALLKIVPKLVKFSEDHHSAKGQGQVSLFDDVMADPAESGLDEDEFALPADAVEESPLSSLLTEKKLLGVFLSQHPMDLFQGDQKRFNQCHLGQIAAHAGNKDITVACFLTATSIRIAKKSGKKMIYYALEDNNAAIEAMTFDEGDEAELPEKNTPVKVSLAVTKSFKGDGLNIRVNSIESLDESRRQIRHAKIAVDLHSKSWPAENFTLLDEVLAEHPGQTKVRLALRYDQAEVNINPLDRQVALTNRLFEQLEGLKAKGIRMEY